MGHFIGLYHVNDPFIDSVMYPSVTHSTIYRSPYTYDADSISSLYGLATAVPALLGGSGPNGQAALPHQDFMPEEEGPGEPTIIQMELMPSGSCIHKQDGKIIAVH